MTASPATLAGLPPRVGGREPPRGDPPVIAIVGPTATGKSEIAFRLAKELDAEIVSVDSVQLYRGLDVGSAKPPPEWRREVPHHMVDVLEPWEEASAGWYRQVARESILGIRRAGKPVIVVGGSPLYYLALTTDLPLQPPDRRIRGEVEALFESEGVEGLRRRLSEAAPSVLSSIDAENPRRLLRALEVVEARLRQGQDPQGWYRGVAAYLGGGLPLVGVGISLPRATHKAAIRRRAEDMLDRGLVEEVRTLFSNDRRRPAPSVASAIGYRQVREGLSRGAGRSELVAAIATATWALARRQKAWFRRDRRICWISAFDPESTASWTREYVLRKSETLALQTGTAAADPELVSDGRCTPHGIG